MRNRQRASNRWFYPHISLIICMVQIESLPLVLTGLGLTVSIFYYTMVLRNANKTQQLHLETRQAQLFIQIYNKFTDVNFMKNFNIAMKKISWLNFGDYTNKYNTEENQETICLS